MSVWVLCCHKMFMVTQGQHLFPAIDYSVSTEDKTSGNSLRLQHRKFKLEITKNCLSEWLSNGTSYP